MTRRNAPDGDEQDRSRSPSHAAVDAGLDERRAEEPGDRVDDRRRRAPAAGACGTPAGASRARSRDPGGVSRVEVERRVVADRAERLDRARGVRGRGEAAAQPAHAAPPRPAETRRPAEAREPGIGRPARSGRIRVVGATPRRRRTAPRAEASTIATAASTAGASASTSPRVVVVEPVIRARYVALRLDELVVRALVDDPPVLEHDDPVGQVQGRLAVRDEQHGAALELAAERLVDGLLRARVDGAGRVVEDQDPRIAQDRPRQRDPLPLPAREAQPPLADDGVVAEGQRLDESPACDARAAVLDLGVASPPGVRRRCSPRPCRRTGSCLRRPCRSLPRSDGRRDVAEVVPVDRARARWPGRANRARAAAPRSICRCRSVRRGRRARRRGCAGRSRRGAGVCVGVAERRHRSKATSPRMRRRSVASGASRRSSDRRSRSWKIRSIPTCACWPIARTPASWRAGAMSAATYEVKARKVPIVMLPCRASQPPRARIATCPSVGIASRSGWKRDWMRTARICDPYRPVAARAIGSTSRALAAEGLDDAHAGDVLVDDLGDLALLLLGVPGRGEDASAASGSDDEHERRHHHQADDGEQRRQREHDDERQHHQHDVAAHDRQHVQQALHEGGVGVRAADELTGRHPCRGTPRRSAAGGRACRCAGRSAPRARPCRPDSAAGR